MHLLINGLSARLGGGQTYLYQLLRHVPADWQVTLLSSGGLAVGAVPSQVTHLVMPALSNPFRRALWEYAQLEKLAMARHCDVLMNPACLLPSIQNPRIKTAVTFQNMLPFDPVQRQRYPFFSYRRLRDFLLERAMLSAMHHADLVIFISAFARGYITHVRGVNPKHSALIPHALDPMFVVRDDGVPAPLPADFPLQHAPYFLYVSFLDYYKCHREMLRAYAALKAQHGVTTKLVLVGTGYARYVALVKNDIAALGLTNDVVLLGNVAHASLPALYQNATINLFASTCENCPNILLEMMAAGAPALVSNRGPMPEIADETVRYFDPMNHEEFVAQWADMLHHLDVAKVNAARAVLRVKGHRWEDAIAQTYMAMELTVMPL